MRRTLLIILMFSCAVKAFASHIVGGEVFYKYVGPGAAAGTSVYEVSIRLFRDCNVACGDGTNVACLPVAAVMAIYPAASPHNPHYVIRAALGDSQSITLTAYPTCVTNRPPVCYQVKTYSYIITLPDTDDGYVIAYQDCCRAAAKNQNGVEFTASGLPGATYSATIPGKTTLSAGHNNSAIFKLKDTALVCLGAKLSIDFSADDKDGDSLGYAITPAYDGGDFFSSSCTFTTENGLVCGDYVAAGPPPYKYISTYNEGLGFSGNQPLGADVSINPATGLITGFAPEYAGRYITNVFVYEWRGGKLIAMHQKDFIIRVEDCGLPVAKLEPYYQSCKTFGLTFENGSTSPLIRSYNWEFGDVKNVNDTSSSPVPSHTFSDTGIYKVTLITNKGLECSDSTTTLAKVFPGFIPDFSVKGSCIFTPFSFTDLTTTKYGVVNSWRWDFGDFSAASDATLVDTSMLENPAHAYGAIQQAGVRLIVGNSGGCIDTIKKVIAVHGKPPLQLSFKDTLICLRDTIQLNLVDSLPAPGTFTWSPQVNISNTDVINPRVYPGSTTVYRIAVDDNGCTNDDSVVVNVIPALTLNAGADTTICLGDSIRIFTVSNAVHFTWIPGTGVNDVNTKNPFIKPVASMDYEVIAAAGSCSATDNITINTVPYPQVKSSSDTTICFGKTVKLYASTAAPVFTWSPVNSLLQPNTLSPVAGPQSTTAYIITVTDVLGCPKPVSDTTIVTVIRAYVFAGDDTAIVANQPLQLNATGSGSYKWLPATGLDDANIPNPIAMLGLQYDSVTYRVTVSTAEGCTADDDIKVIVFKTMPDIFVPSAFTPNGDRMNDVVHPKPVGIKEFRYFRIYNRYGQLLFSTKTTGEGWDGSIYGIRQPAGTYVYMAQGIDYTGKVVNKKGTIVLIR